MPQDAVTISYLANELNANISGGKVTKITMPENDEVNISIYSDGKTKILVASANGTSPRLHLTSACKASPPTPPSFCMLLRKYLTNAEIRSVSSQFGERIVYIRFISKTEMKDLAEFTLVVELMNRQSNIFLLDSKEIILGSVKQLYAENCEKRLLVVSGQYALPPSFDRASPTNRAEAITALSAFSDGDLAKYLCDKIGGFAYKTAVEVCLHALNEITFEDRLNNEQKSLVAEWAEKIYSMPLAPNISLENGKICDFYAFDYLSETREKRIASSINAAIDTYYTDKVKAERIGEHSRQIKQILKNALTKNERKLQLQTEEIERAKSCETNKIYGDLITNNLYKLRGGEISLTAENYYSETVETVVIPLDKQLSPAQNAQSYYKKYAKQKRTIELVGAQLVDTSETVEQLKSIESKLKKATELSELDLIKDDLIALGLMKKPQTKGKKNVTKVFRPYKFVIDGYTIFVGRNSLENAYVTFELGHNKDIFFHAKKNFGSHVLLKFDGKQFSDDIYVKAAEIAAFFSNGTPNERIEIDYTEIKNVKKVKGGKLGLVIYHTNYSMFVNPNKHEEFMTK